MQLPTKHLWESQKIYSHPTPQGHWCFLENASVLTAACLDPCGKAVIALPA